MKRKGNLIHLHIQAFTLDKFHQKNKNLLTDLPFELVKWTIRWQRKHPKEKFFHFYHVIIIRKNENIYIYIWDCDQV
jgi:hypothetical protein